MSTPSPSSISDPGPLVVSADPDLVDEVRRLAAATGVVPQVVPDGRTARQRWAGAPAVLVGETAAAELAGLHLPRRPAVLLLTRDGVEVEAWRRAVAVGAEAVLSLRDDRNQVVERLGSCGDDTRGAALVCVTGACGGAGASVLAGALALTARTRGLPSLLVDADPWGGGTDLLLGGEDAVGLRWPDLAEASGRVSAASLREVLPVVDDVTLLSWGREEPVPVPAASMRSVLTAACGGHRLVVVDVPRRDEEAALEALALASCTVLLVPAEVRAVAAARGRAAVLRRATTDLRVLVRDPARGGLDAERVADSLALPLLAQLRSERGLTAWIDQGLGPVRRRRGPLARACSTVLDGCGLFPEPTS